MEVRDHRIPEAWYGLSPNHGGRLTGPKFLVMHTTADWSAEGARDYLMNPRAPFTPSAHLVAGRDGRLWQIVPFDLKARHAGRSFYRGITGLNHHAIGIEIDNIGWLRPDGRGGFTDPYGRRVVDPPDHLLAPHPQAGPTVLAWPLCPEVQLAALDEAVRAILAAYPTIRDIVGHDEISTDATDPGPAFPMTRFRRQLDDRSADAALHVTTATLNIRGGPGTAFETLAFGPLAPGTPVRSLTRRDDWQFVALADDVTRRGWVHDFYLAHG